MADGFEFGRGVVYGLGDWDASDVGPWDLAGGAPAVTLSVEGCEWLFQDSPRLERQGGEAASVQSPVGSVETVRLNERISGPEVVRSVFVLLVRRWRAWWFAFPGERQLPRE